MRHAIITAMLCTAAYGHAAGQSPVTARGQSPGFPSPNEERLDSLQVIGVFQHAPSFQAVFGDSDHDGRNEIILVGSTPTLQGVLRILEHTGTGEFKVVFEGPNLIPLAVGDVDQDGKSDLVVQSGASLFVYESEDEHSHPSNLVWQSAPISSQLGYDEIADTDSDGRLEIVHRFWAGEPRFVIFECQGDNTYVQKFLSPIEKPEHGARYSATLQTTYSPWTGDRLIFDLDEDGGPEIVMSSEGKLEIFESPADDVWEHVYTDSTGLINSRILSGGVDTDGDGKRELFLGGEEPDTGERKVFIYQADGDGSFQRVATLAAFDNASGYQSGAIAQLEPGGKPRFIWNIYLQLRFYVATSPGQWELERIIPDPSFHLTVYARDLNRNGRDEIYWLTNNRTYQSLILERPTLPTDVSNDHDERLSGLLRVYPSPYRSGATVFVDPSISSRAAEWSAFDAAGRLVFRHGVLGAPREAWVLPALRPGIYFLRVTDVVGRPLATGRAAVVR